MVILKKNSTKIFIFANIFLFINLPLTYAKCINKKCTTEEKYREKKINLSKLIKKKTIKDSKLFDHQIKSLNNDSLKKLIIENDIRLDHFVYALTANNLDFNREEEFFIDIESDKQYIENGINYAEGNVIFYLKNGTLKTDKFSYEKTSGRVKLTGNIKFEKGKQYFKAKFLNYNVNLQEGEILDVAGVLSFKNLDKDLDLYPIEGNSSIEKEIDLFDRPEELELLNTKNVRLNNILGINPDLGKISNWKFKSKKLSVKKNLWQSEKIEFSNDPYKNTQISVESKNFKAEIIDDKYKFTSKSTFLVFENKIRIPVGKRTISDQGSVPLKWGVGYDQEKKDGIYIYRSSESYKLFKNLKFRLSPYFLVQRAIRGKTRSFRAEGSSFLDDKLLQEINYSDYLSLEADIKGEIFNWEPNIKMSLGTLNIKRLDDSFSLDANISRNLYSNSNETENFSVRTGFYGQFLKDNIYTAYGTKILADYSSEKKDVYDRYSLILDIGDFQSKSLNTNVLLGLDRYGINASWNRKYRLIDLNDKSLIYNSKFNKTPTLVDNALYFDKKISTSAYQYSNNTSQSIFLAGIGPSLKLGNLKKNFLDYSYLSVMPEFILKRGESPFAFDNFNSHSRVKFNLQQQIYGPILLAIKTDFIISNKSEDYSQFKNIEYSVDISRRAYKVSFYYKNNNSFGMKFNIFNFGSRSFDKSSI